MKPLLFTYVLTYGGVLASLVRPYYGFLIYVAFGIIKPDSLWAWIVPEGSYSRIVAIGFLIGWFIHGCGDWRLGRGGVVLACLCGYWVIMILAAIFAPVSELAWSQVEPMAKIFLPIVAGATLIDSVAKLKQLAWVIVLSQGYLAYEINLLYFLNPNFIPAEWYHCGLDNNGISITMVTSVGMAFFMGIHSTQWWQRLLALGCAAAMAHVVLFSNSRGGMLSMIVTGVFAFALLPKKPIYILLFCFAGAGAAATTGEGTQQRFLSSFAKKEEGSDEGGKRMDHWKACLDSMRTSPLGVGPSHWRTVAPDYGLPAMEAHSTWLQMGAELGIPGIVCLLGFYLIAMIRLYPMLKDSYPVHDPWLRYLARMVISSLIGFLVAAMFVTLDGVELPYYIGLVGIGVLKVQSARESADSQARFDEPLNASEPTS